MDETQVLNPLLGIAIATVLFTSLYFAFVRPVLRRRYFGKYGIRFSAQVLKVTKTNMEYGDGSFAQPVYEIVFAYQHNQKEYKATKMHGIRYEDNIPKVGGKMQILINPKNRKMLSYLRLSVTLNAHSLRALLPQKNCPTPALLLT